MNCNLISMLTFSDLCNLTQSLIHFSASFSARHSTQTSELCVYMMVIGLGAWFLLYSLNNFFTSTQINWISSIDYYLRSIHLALFLFLYYSSFIHSFPFLSHLKKSTHTTHLLASSHFSEFNRFLMSFSMCLNFEWRADVHFALIRCRFYCIRLYEAPQM